MIYTVRAFYAYIAQLYIYIYIYEMYEYILCTQRTGGDLGYPRGLSLRCDAITFTGATWQVHRWIELMQVHS